MAFNVLNQFSLVDFVLNLADKLSRFFFPKSNLMYTFLD